MRFYVGLWDRCFGERIPMDIPRPDGVPVRRYVTKRWLARAEARGWIEEVKPVAESGGPDAKSAPVDSPDASACFLVEAAKLNAIGMSVPAADKYPVISTYARRGQWDFFITVASVWFAHAALARHPDPKSKELLYRAVEAELSKLAPDACACLLDLQRFVDRTARGSVTVADAVGAWVVWNLVAHRPSGTEWDPAAAIGRILEHNFANWWDDLDRVRR